MRILMLTPQLPYPPRQGTALRNWGILSNLAHNHGHEMWLLAFDEAANTAGAMAPELRAACTQVAAFPVPHRSTLHRLRTLASSSLPDMAWRLWSPAFAAQYADWVTAQRFDIIQVEGIELARYVLTGPRGVPVVFDDHNCEYLLQRRSFEADVRRPQRWHAAAYSFVQWQRLRAFERRVARSVNAVLSVSPQDAAAVSQLAPPVQPHIIFNGIDVAGYDGAALPGTAAVPARPQNPDGRATLVFTGKMDFRPNVDAMLWFGREVFPLITRLAPDTRLVIMGQRPSPRLDVLRTNCNVTLTGAVDDQRPYIAQADVYIAPLRVGGGTRFKLLEAMAMRRPIVSTSMGCEGFDVASGRELMIADTPAAFAAAVVRLLRDEGLRATMVERAHAFVSAYYDWSVIVPRLERVYEDAMKLR